MINGDQDGDGIRDRYGEMGMGMVKGEMVKW